MWTTETDVSTGNTANDPDVLVNTTNLVGEDFKHEPTWENEKHCKTSNTLQEMVKVFYFCQFH